VNVNFRLAVRLSAFEVPLDVRVMPICPGTGVQVSSEFAAVIVRFFNPMFDSASRHAVGKVGEIRDNLAFEIAAQFASKKGHDFLGAKAQCAVAK